MTAGGEMAKAAGLTSPDPETAVTARPARTSASARAVQAGLVALAAAISPPAW